METCIQLDCTKYVQMPMNDLRISICVRFDNLITITKYSSKRIVIFGNNWSVNRMVCPINGT